MCGNRVFGSDNIFYSGVVMILGISNTWWLSMFLALLTLGFFVRFISLKESELYEKGPVMLMWMVVSVCMFFVVFGLYVVEQYS